MKAWFVAYFSVPFSPRKSWKRSGLNKKSELHWDSTLALLFVSIGGFLVAHLTLLATTYEDFFIDDIWGWMMIAYFAQVIRFMLIGSVLKGVTKENDLAMPFNKRLALLLICLAIPAIGNALLSHFAGSFFMMHLFRGLFLVWAYISLYYALCYFTSRKKNKLRLSVVLVGLFDFIVIPLITYVFGVIFSVPL